MPDTLLSLADEIAQEPVQQPEEEDGGILDTIGRSLEGAYDLWKSVGAGVGNAALETKDFIFGEPEENEKSDFRKSWEQRSSQLRDESALNGVAMSTSQFVTGMIGTGKLMAPVKAVQKVRQAGRAGKLAYETARGAATSAVVFDPHEERLSDLIQEFDALENPVTEFLASDPNDSAAMGRLKNALEGIGMDLAVAGSFAMAIKALKLGKAGDEAGAKAILDNLGKEGEEVLQGNRVEKVPAAKVEIKQAKSDASAIPAKADAPAWSHDSWTARKPGEDFTTVEEAAGKIIQSFEEDMAAITKFGSREEAIAQGVMVGKSNIPWQKVGGSEDLQTLMDATAKTLRARMDDAKGGAVLTDQKVRDMVQETAEMFGDDPAGLIGEIARAGKGAKDMVSRMEASYIISRRLFEDTYDAVAKMRLGLLDELGGTPEAAQAEIVKRFQAAADMLAAGNSIRANAGRTMRRMRKDFAISSDDVNAMRSLDPQKLTEVIYASKGDIKKLRQAANPAWQRRVLDEATFSLTNGLLWFYPTHLVNTTTNLYMLAARPTEKWIGSLAQGRRGGAVRKQAQLEMAYTLNSLGDAWSAMVEAFKRGDSILAPHQEEMFERGSRINAEPLPWKQVEGVWDLFHNAYMSANYHNIVGLPTRSLGAVDEFVKTLRYRAMVQARAAVEAGEAGVTGQDLKHHLQRRLNEAFTPDGRAVDSTALYEAQVAAFQQELLSGTVGAGIRNFRHNVPATALVLPFVKTPVNVLRYAWKMTPGLNLLQTEYRQMLLGKMGAEAQAHAFGQMAMGSMFMAIAAQLALAGKITGGGPADTGLKKQLLGQGWQPYSFVIDNEDGSKTYFPIGRFDPIGMPFGMVADIVDMTITHPDTREAEKGAMAVGVSLAKAFSEKTFLMNVNQLIRALSEPESNMARYLGGMAGNTMIPASSALRNYANSDPYMREARGFLDNALKGMPGYSEDLPPQRDAFGSPLWRKRGLTTNQKLDLVDAEHSRIIMETGYGVHPPQPTRNGVDLREVTLADGRNAYDLLQERAAQPPKGKSLKSTLAKLIESDQYDRLVDGPGDVRGTRLNAIRGVVAKYREVAFKSMLKDYPEFRQQLYQKQLQVKSEFTSQKANDREQPSNAEELLSTLGYGQ